jgi:hypothetical protein
MLLDVLGGVVFGIGVALAAPSSTEAASLKPVALDHDAYGETFTFVADLDGGAYAQIQLSVTNLGPGSGHGICRALLVQPGKEPWTADERVGSTGWRHAKSDSGEMLQVGPCRVRNSAAELAVSAQLKGRMLQLRYPHFAKMENPPGHVLSIGGARHVTQLIQPAAPVRLRVQERGEKPTDLRGAGYADHSMSTVEPKALANRWIRFRALRGDKNVLLLGREAKDGAFAPLWLRAKDGKYEELASFAVKRSGDGKKPAFEATVAGKGDRRLLLRSGDFLYRHAPVEELGILSTVVKPFAGSPVTYTYRATLTGLGGAEIPGILEISLSEE